MPGFPPWHRRPIYEYNRHKLTPVTLYVAPGVYVQPDRHFFTDMGSVPELIQYGIPKDLHNPSFVLHDWPCISHTLYFSSHPEGPYVECPVSSETAARLLGIGIYAAGFPVRARLVYRMVKACGPQWAVGDTPDKRRVIDRL
jgi:hypothetical protein